MEKILLKNVDIPNSDTIEVYLERGGYQAARKALTEMTPQEITDEVKTSGLRGRGGAGFPTGLKWSFMPQEAEGPKFLCVNADEGEPGTFKDRLLVEGDPHQVLEGIIIASYALDVHQAFVYFRGEFSQPIKLWTKAVSDAYDRGLLGENILGTDFNLDVSPYRGAGAYICGEETALMESVEGKRGEPRLKPPFPTERGLFGQPTIVNNIETLANIPHIVSRGGEWYSGIGTPKSTGPKLFCVSGHVNQPGNYELPLGTPLREIIFDHAGGMLDGRELKAVIPGGSSTPMLNADQVDVSMDFESLVDAGSMLGTGAVIVMDETTCIVGATLRLARFYAHESCGKCVPCRSGTPKLVQVLETIQAGNGQAKDIDTLLRICEGMRGRTLCPMGDAAINPVLSSIHHFRDEYEYHATHGRCAIGA
jgi:NADH-quinone oxidoreductase subunit F